MESFATKSVNLPA